MCNTMCQHNFDVQCGWSCRRRRNCEYGPIKQRMLNGVEPVTNDDMRAANVEQRRLTGTVDELAAKADMLRNNFVDWVANEIGYDYPVNVRDGGERKHKKSCMVLGFVRCLKCRIYDPDKCEYTDKYSTTPVQATMLSLVVPTKRGKVITPAEPYLLYRPFTIQGIADGFRGGVDEHDTVRKRQAAEYMALRIE